MRSRRSIYFLVVPEEEGPVVVDVADVAGWLLLPPWLGPSLRTLTAPQTAAAHNTCRKKRFLVGYMLRIVSETTDLVIPPRHRVSESAVIAGEQKAQKTRKGQKSGCYKRNRNTTSRMRSSS